MIQHQRPALTETAPAAIAVFIASSWITLEAQGLARRWRENSDRRVQRVELTDEGVVSFDRLREAAVRHDERLRSELTAEETAQLAELLDRLQAGLEAAFARRGAPARRSAR